MKLTIRECVEAIVNRVMADGNEDELREAMQFVGQSANETDVDLDAATPAGKRLHAAEMAFYDAMGDLLRASIDVGEEA